MKKQLEFSFPKVKKGIMIRKTSYQIFVKKEEKLINTSYVIIILLKIFILYNSDK